MNIDELLKAAIKQMDTVDKEKLSWQQHLADMQPQVKIDEEPLEPALGLGTEIPREDIECDTGIILIKSFVATLWNNSTNMSVSEETTTPAKEFIVKFPNFVDIEKEIQPYSGAQCLKLSKHGKRNPLD